MAHEIAAGRAADVFMALGFVVTIAGFFTHRYGWICIGTALLWVGAMTMAPLPEKVETKLDKK